MPHPLLCKHARSCVDAFFHARYNLFTPSFTQTKRNLWIGARPAEGPTCTICLSAHFCPLPSDRSAWELVAWPTAGEVTANRVTPSRQYPPPPPNIHPPPPLIPPLPCGCSPLSHYCRSPQNSNFCRCLLATNWTQWPLVKPDAVCTRAKGRLRRERGRGCVSQGGKDWLGNLVFVLVNGTPRGTWELELENFIFQGLKFRFI